VEEEASEEKAKRSWRIGSSSYINPKVMEKEATENTKGTRWSSHQDPVTVETKTKNHQKGKESLGRKS
jgi:hypothetical protein